MNDPILTMARQPHVETEETAVILATIRFHFVNKDLGISGQNVSRAKQIKTL